MSLIDRAFRLPRRGPRVGGDALLEALAGVATHDEPYPFSYQGAADVDVLAHFSAEPLPHVLYTTFGLSRVKSTVPVAGVQMELSMRTRVTSPLPLQWPADALALLCAHVRRTGRTLEPGHYMELPRPHMGRLAGFSFVADPLVPEVQTVTGAVRYTYAVGLTTEDLDDALRWDPVRFTGELGEVFPLGLTDPGRAALRRDPAARARVEAAVAEEGSSISAVEAKILGIEPGRIDLDPGAVSALLRAMRGRLKFGRAFALVSRRGETWVRFTPGEATETGEGFLEVGAQPALVDEILAVLDPAPGVYRLRSAPLEIHVVDPRS
ncbi:suppressor of fused domain protein [Corynebacterium sp. UBA2622]|uniref:suppressor of fused domain protein n=1 Tax=Corynebacterium sp. UBA2622 TaxID=1946393 RepID=UPI0025BCFF33|nr:suppressor of fused domain protein [Corynebacterium sp. UBA2622]